MRTSVRPVGSTQGVVTRNRVVASAAVDTDPHHREPGEVAAFRSGCRPVPAIERVAELLTQDRIAAVLAKMRSLPAPDAADICRFEQQEPLIREQLPADRPQMVSGSNG